MTAPAHLAIARRLAEEQMTSTCTITRASTGPRVFDEATGTYSDPEPDLVYAGRCKVQDNGRSVGNAEAGELRVSIDSLAVHLPIEGSGGVRRNDDVLIDSNPNDPALVGARFVAQAPHSATAKTARRIPVERVV